VNARAKLLAILVRDGGIDWHRRSGWRSLLRAALLLVNPEKLARLLELDLVKDTLVPVRGAESFAFLTRALYLARALDMEQRLDCALHHYAYEQATFSPAYVDAVYRGEGLELWRGASDDHEFVIRLVTANDNLFEGSLSIVAFVDAQRVCVLSFSYVDAALFGAASEPIAFITRKQSGRHSEEQHAFSRAFDHSSPPYFCLAALAGVALAIGMRAIAGIRHDAHPSWHPRDAEGMRKSYEGFWALFHAADLDEKAVRIPLPLEPRDLADVAKSHRRRAKARRRHWAAVTASAAAALRPYLTRPPKDEVS